MKQAYRDSLWISFGSKQQEISMHDIKELRYVASLKKYLQEQGFTRFIVLDQQHLAVGICAEDIDGKQESWFEYQADFVVTKKKDIALIVLTADCIPLILYDPYKNVVGLVHAGWRGLAQNIVQEAILSMQNLYGIQLHDMVCIVGPCAQSCCYEVSADFIEQFKQFDWAYNALSMRDGRWYFNSFLFMQEQLQRIGVLKQNIDINYMQCTICNVTFCSFRREKNLSGRQATIVALQ